MLTDAEFMTLHDAANVLRMRDEPEAAAAVFGALVRIAGGGASGIRSREPVDRDAAKRAGIAARQAERAAVAAACTIKEESRNG